MIAYHGDESIKLNILGQLARHRAADEIVKGKYWENGKGCAVGCTLHSANHADYEARFGIPRMLARLEDCIFEGLPNGDAKAWPERFMSAVKPGADLSRVGWQFLHWLLTTESVNPGINHPLVKDAVRQCADVIAQLAKGEKQAEGSAARSAAYSARLAYSVADSAAGAADSAYSVARSARSAAYSADSAADAADSAYSVARSVADAADSAARSARSAYSVARSVAYATMSNKLIELLETA